MKWYDVFSNFYDGSLEKLYFASRQRAVALLNVADNQTVLDVACGTGANFQHIRKRSATAPIYGTDYSAGMLRRAHDNIARNNWQNIQLFQADARTLSATTIAQQANHAQPFDNVLCALGLSVIPEWETVLNKLLGLLKAGGKIVIIDVYAEKRNFNTWLVEKIASADLDRKIWQTLEKKTTDFSLEYMPVKESKVGGKLFVAAGVKREL